MRLFRRSAAVLLVTSIVMTLSIQASSETTDSTSIAPDSVTSPGAVVIDRSDLTRFPYRSIEEILALQNGTTILYQKQAEDVSLSAPRIAVRGMRPIETGYFLNGVQINDSYSGYLTARISPMALEQIALEPAAFDARYGFSGSSAVRMVTRRGGSRYAGSIEGITDNTLGSDLDQNWYTATLGGPVPGLPTGRFFGCVERRYFGDRSPSSKTDDFLPGSSKRLPGNWLDGWSFNGRLDYEPRSNMSITGTADWSVTEWSQYLQQYFYDWEHLPYSKDRNLTLSGRLTHLLTPDLHYSLQVSYTQSERFVGDGKYKEDFDAYLRPYYNPGTDMEGVFYRWDDYTHETDSVDESHVWDRYERNKSSRLGARCDVSRRIGERHEISVGAEYRRYSIRQYANYGPTSPGRFAPRLAYHYGYDRYGNEDDDGGAGWGNAVQHPVEYGLNVGGRFGFGALEFEPGVRFDVFDRNTLVPKDWLDPMGDDDMFNRADLRDADALTRWSPRISFRLAPSGAGLLISGGYGTYYSQEPYSYVYSGAWDLFDFGRTSGNPEIDPVELSSWELSITQEVASGMRLKATGFRNETNNYPVHSYSMTDDPDYPRYGVTYSRYKPVGRIRSWGLQTEIAFTWKRRLELRARCTTEDVESKYLEWSVATDDLEQQLTLGTQLLVRTGAGEGPSIGGIHCLERLNLVITAESRSGLPYTPLTWTVGFFGDTYLERGGAGRNLATTPHTTAINFMLQREIPLRGFTITPFLWVQNLLDAQITRYVYPATRVGYDDGYLTTAEAAEKVAFFQAPYDQSGLNFEQKYKLLRHDPTNYGPPRQVFFGLRVSF